MSYNSRDYLGNEVVNVNEEISLSAQTSADIARTLRYHASLIDDLMKDRYNICAISLLSK